MEEFEKNVEATENEEVDYAQSVAEIEIDSKEPEPELTVEAVAHETEEPVLQEEIAEEQAPEVVEVKEEKPKKERKALPVKQLFKRIGFGALGVVAALLIAFGIIAVYRHQFGILATADDVELSWADQYGEMTLYADSYTTIKNLNVRVTFRNANDLLKAISMEKYFSEVTPEIEQNFALCQTAQIAAALGCEEKDIFVQTEVLGGKIRNDVNRKTYGKKISEDCSFTFKIRYHELSNKYLLVVNVKNNSERTITSVRNLSASIDFGKYGVFELDPCTLSFTPPKNDIPAGSVSTEVLLDSADAFMSLPIGGIGTSFEITSESYILHSYAVSN